VPVGVTWVFQPEAALVEAGAGSIVHSYGELRTSLSEFLGNPSHTAA